MIIISYNKVFRHTKINHKSVNLPEVKTTFKCAKKSTECLCKRIVEENYPSTLELNEFLKLLLDYFNNWFS
jgi:hypothetical protein